MKSGVGFLGLYDLRPYDDLVRRRLIDPSTKPRFGRPRTQDADWLRWVARDDARVALGVGKIGRSKTSLAKEQARRVPEDLPEAAEAMRRRAHRKLSRQDREFRAAVVILFWYWGKANYGQRDSALMRIRDRAVNMNAGEIAFLCNALLRDSRHPGSIRRRPTLRFGAYRQPLPLALGFILNWAFKEAFG